MKKLFFVLIFALFLGTPALAKQCPPPSFEPQIQVYSSYGKLKYDTSKNNAQITVLAKKAGLDEKGLFASGLATVDISTDISINTIGKQMGDNFVCIYPTKINLFIGFADPTIYISNALKKDSCEYKIVLRHEQTHQYINKEILDYFLPLFSKAFAEIVNSTPPVKASHVNDIDAASEYLTQKYNQKLLPLANFLKTEMLKEQSRLDNQSNYLHEKNLCR